MVTQRDPDGDGYNAVVSPHPIRVSTGQDTRTLITLQTFEWRGFEWRGRAYSTATSASTVKTENAKVFSSEAFDCNGEWKLEGRPYRSFATRGSKHRGLAESSVEKQAESGKYSTRRRGSLSNSCSRLFNPANE